MSISLYTYCPAYCDFDYCPGDCDKCPKAENRKEEDEDGESG